tara:strand:+ start:363 stop:872 length:510 start_codon:yes stop_codon:yes gene_type:complete
MFRDYRKVQGYESDYIISNYGEVWSIKFGKVRLMKACPNSQGYLHVVLCKNGKQTTHKPHILVGEAFIGLRTGTLTYDHIDRNNQNNRADNIRLATKSEQAQNQKLRKTNKLGFKHICEKVNHGYQYYKIQIRRNGKRVEKHFNKDKYTLEQVVEERDKILCSQSCPEI